MKIQGITLPARLVAFASGVLLLLGSAATPVRAATAGATADRLWKADRLLFCNNPERLRAGGTYADARLLAGKTYRIFWHYRNAGRQTRPLVVAFVRGDGAPFSVSVRKGTADAQNDPSRAGSQAMARFLNAAVRRYAAPNGAARFPTTLHPRQVASGVLAVSADRDVRLRIYFDRDGPAAPGMQVISVDAPRREITVSLSPEQPRYYARIGEREAGMAKELGGTYGLFYHFRVVAPPGRKVRVAFSPRGGKAGIVGTLAGRTYRSPIVGATRWAVLGETVAAANAFFLRTAPFGGVFYPVEIAFHLL